MLQSDIIRKVDRFDRAASRERLLSPQMIQKTKAVRFPSMAGIQARIIQTLRRADEGAGITEIDYYEIEFLNSAVEEWSSSHGTYFVGDIIKYTSEGIQLIYGCILEHEAAVGKEPTNETYWEESTHLKAWVFGYSGDLIETIPWFQPDDIVKVIKYSDSRWEDREWWILETVVRVQTPSNGTVDCSIAWNAVDNRAMGVF